MSGCACREVARSPILTARQPRDCHRRPRAEHARARRRRCRPRRDPSPPAGLSLCGRFIAMRHGERDPLPRGVPRLASGACIEPPWHLRSTASDTGAVQLQQKPRTLARGCLRGALLDAINAERLDSAQPRSKPCSSFWRNYGEVFDWRTCRWSRLSVVENASMQKWPVCSRRKARLTGSGSRLACGLPHGKSCGLQ